MYKAHINVLIACEESQALATRFNANGFRAFSCDLQDCSGSHPEFHIKGDCLNLLDGHCFFQTQDKQYHYVNQWDLIIAHPPCTYLTVTGNRWYNVEKYGDKAIQRLKDREEAIDFFMRFTKTTCKHVAIENPVGVMSTIYRKPDQIIQPYQFGDHHRKATCLWLKGLPTLSPTEIVEPKVVRINGTSMDEDYCKAWGLPKEERQRIRSKTYPGIANAIVSQWGAWLKFLISEEFTETP